MPGWSKLLKSGRSKASVLRAVAAAGAAGYGASRTKTIEGRGKGAARKTRLKTGRSTTKTKRKRSKTQTVQAPQLGTGGESYSSCVYKGRPSKMHKTVKVMTNQFVYKVNKAFFTSSNWGQQGVTSVRGFINGDEMLAVVEKAQRFYNSNGAGATVIVDPGTAGYQARKFFLDSVTATYRFANNGNTLINVQIYDLICKTTQTVLRNAQGEFVLAMEDEDNAVTTAPFSVFQPNCSPTQFKLFNIQYKTIKKTTVRLHPGQVHHHKLVLKHNKVLDVSYFNNYKQVRGLTSQCMFITQGIPVDRLRTTVSTGDLNPVDGNPVVAPTTGFGPTINQSTSAPENNITLSATKLTGSVDYEYKIRAVNVFPKGYYLENDYEEAAGDVLIGQFYVQNDDSNRPQALNVENSARPLDWA